MHGRSGGAGTAAASLDAGRSIAIFIRLPVAVVVQAILATLCAGQYLPQAFACPGFVLLAFLLSCLADAGAGCAFGPFVAISFLSAGAWAVLVNGSITVFVCLSFALLALRQYLIAAGQPHAGLAALRACLA
jgi:hypothetical protein